MEIKKCLILLNIISIFLTFSCNGCYKVKNKNLNKSEIITLKIIGPYRECFAIDSIGIKFSDRFPNCRIVYEYLQDYGNTASIRIASDESPDIFLIDSIQSNSPYKDYALDLNTQKTKLDLSNTFNNLIKNYEYFNTDILYSIPLGADVRGMFVNTTILTQSNIRVPENKTQLLQACEILKKAGYVPMQGNPLMFSQLLEYPNIVNTIAKSPDYKKTFDMINNCEDGFEEIFREPIEFLYTLIENKYYDYKFVETEYHNCINLSDDAIVMDFLNIKKVDSELKKIDDIGCIPFLPATASLQTTMNKIKEDFHSNIEYSFIMSPVTDHGGIVHLSPGKAIAINKNSKQLDWTIEFLNFIFTDENNKQFNKDFNLLPNTKDLIKYTSIKYSIPIKNISELGNVNFDYNFYNSVVKSLITLSKGNNPKYMKPDGSLYSVDHYMKILKTNIIETRNKDLNIQ